MKSKRDARLKRARKSRSKIRELLVPRLCVYRSPRHTYAQIISEDGAQVKVAASTLESALRDGPTGNIERVAFDRSGYKYHGRVKALADAAREAGLQF